MRKKVYRFFETGTIPGIPGEFSAGSIVVIDEDTMTIINNEALISASDEIQKQEKEQEQSDTDKMNAIKITPDETEGES